MGRRSFWFWLSLAVVVSAVLRSIYALHLGPPVRGDEAVNAIMAQRIFRGEDAPLFLYGVDYLSSLEGWAAAAFWRLAGEGDFGFRILPLVSSVGSVAALGLLLRRWFGERSAILAAWILAVPPFPYFHLTSVAIGGYPEGLLAGLVLWACFDRLARREAGGVAASARAYAGFSLLVGLSWWVYPMVLGFLVPMGLYWARHPEGPGSGRFPWRHLWFPWQAARSPALARALRILQGVNALAALLVLWVMATRGGSFQAGGIKIQLEHASKMALWNVALTASILGLLCLERRVLPWTRGLVALAAGVGLGKSIWVLERLRSSEIDPIHLRFKFAQGSDWVEHARQFFQEILPAFAGMPRTLPYPPMFVWTAVGVAFFVFVLGRFFRRYGSGILAHIRMRQGPVDPAVAFLSILVTLPLMNFARGGAGMPLRYWAYLLPVLAAAVAIVVADRFSRPDWKGRLSGAVLLLVLVLGARQTVREVLALTPFPIDRQKGLLSRLAALRVEGGYAEYDLAHSLTCLSREKVFFAPFDYPARVPGTRGRLEGLLRHAYLFFVEPGSADLSRSAQFKAHLKARRIRYRSEESQGVEICVIDAPPLSPERMKWKR